jgi:hypothetical protein
VGYTTAVMKGRSTHLRRAAGVRVALVAALAALSLLVLVTPALAAGVDDWQHTWEVVRLAKALQGRAIPPRGAFVYYLGDSIARESTVSDKAWTAQLARRAQKAGKVTAFGYTVAGHNQTFGMDERILQGLPPTQSGQPRGILLIGVGISRFIGPPTPMDPWPLDPPPAGQLPELSPWGQHHYDGRPPLSSTRKRELVQRWMDRRWAGFQSNKAANLAAIGRIIETAKAKGLRPVILDLPLNVAVVGAGLDRPRAAISSGCTDLARRHGIKYLHFTKAVGLPSADFWDLHHLLEPGYRRWQSRLSDELVKVLPTPSAASPRFAAFLRPATL